ncbi:MAG: hypothetical protein U5L11_03075 [Arhodomonas sp.]|nr:hypothetical protein [Arhodomonas sp.]
MSQDFYAKHQATLDKAIEVTRTREFWSPDPEMPSGKVYGEDAAEQGEAAFKARLNQPFKVEMPGIVGEVGEEVSPYGFDLGIRYPKVDPDTPRARHDGVAEGLAGCRPGAARRRLCRDPRAAEQA